MVPPATDVLVLLIGEVLTDPRVLRTSRSLRDLGARVTVACTNPGSRPERETIKDLSIVRFPHPPEFFLKRFYNRFHGFLRPDAGRSLSRLHETVPANPFAAAVRNAAVTLNWRHLRGGALAVNRAMVAAFGRRTFDLVHANDMDTLEAGVSLRRSGAARALLYDSHEYWPGVGVEGSAPNHDIARIEQEGILAADYVVTVNPLIAERLRDRYHLSVMPAVVMNCPYRRDISAIETNHVPLRVLYQGKVQAFRGLESLVRAFERIEGMELTIAGYGPLEERLRLMVRGAGLEDRVRLTGRYIPDDTFAIIAGHDIGILPFEPVTRNIYYTSPNKLFDYLMGGLAVVSSDLPFMRGIIEGNKAGVMLPSLGPDAIAETLTALAADPDRLLGFRLAARTAGYGRYYWEQEFGDGYPWRP